MNIFVKTLSGKELHIDVVPSNTVLDLKRKVQLEEGIPLDQQKAVFADKLLENDRTLREYDIQDNDIFSLNTVRRQASHPPVSISPPRFYCDAGAKPALELFGAVPQTLHEEAAEDIRLRGASPPDESRC